MSTRNTWMYVSPVTKQNRSVEDGTHLTHQHLPCRLVYAGKETYPCTTVLINHILKTCDMQFNILPHESNATQRI